MPFSSFTRRQLHRLTVAGAGALALGGWALAAATTALADTTATPTDPWPAFHGDARHTGLGAGRGPRELTLDWYVPTGSPVDGSPVIASDGSVYVTATGGVVFGLSADGAQRWDYRPGTRVLGSPAIGSDGRILFGDAKGRLRALNTVDGTVAWTSPGHGPIRSTPVVGNDGTIYFGTDNGELIGLTAEGKARFIQKATRDIVMSPAVAPNGEVYWGSLDGHFRRMAPNGDIRWTIDLGGELPATPAIGTDGTVYVGAGNALVALDGDNGAVKWRYDTGGAVTVTPAIAADGRLLFGTQDGRFLALSPAGEVTWKATIGSAIRSSAVVGTDGAFYFGAGDGFVYGYDASGNRLSAFHALDAVNGAAAMDRQGRIYIGSADNRMYVLKDNVRALAQAGNAGLSGSLVRDPHTGKVYVLVNGQRRYIPDPQTQLLLNLAGQPTSLTDPELAAYPEGPALPSLSEGNLVSQSNGPLYVIQGGKRSWIPDLVAFNAGGYSWDNVVKADDMVVRSITLDVQPGELLQGGTDRVYLVEAGKRRWITGQSVFTAHDFRWSNVLFVTERQLQTLPEGDPLTS